MMADDYEFMQDLNGGKRSAYAMIEEDDIEEIEEDGRNDKQI